jgi:hypothetical protein
MSVDIRNRFVDKAALLQQNAGPIGTSRYLLSVSVEHLSSLSLLMSSNHLVARTKGACNALTHLLRPPVLRFLYGCSQRGSTTFDNRIGHTPEYISEELGCLFELACILDGYAFSSQVL